MSVVYWEDEDGAPKYGSVLPAEVRQPVKKDRESITLVDESYDTEANVVILRERIRLSAKPGKYVLALRIADGSNQEKLLGMRAMVIKILPHE